MRIGIKYLALLKQFVQFVINDFKRIVRATTGSKSRRQDGPVKTKYGFSIHYETTTYHATRLRDQVIRGQYEPDMLTVRKLLRPGDTVVDIGAHEGFYSLLLAQAVGPSGKVYACEPNEENLRYLRENININAAQNIVIIPKAIGNETGRKKFYCAEGLGAWGSLDTRWSGQEHFIEVEVDTLDRVLADVTSPISFMKVDTEGNDYYVILGADSILSEHKPHLCVEVSYSYWAMIEASLESMLNKFRDKGYTLFWLNEGKFMPYPTGLSRRVFNLYAFHETKLPQLRRDRPNLFAPERSH